jgi:hypothetical protein
LGFRDAIGGTLMMYVTNTLVKIHARAGPPKAARTDVWRASRRRP